MRISVLSMWLLAASAVTASAADGDYQRAMHAECGKPGGASFPEGVIPNVKAALAVATRILTDIHGPNGLKSQILQVELRDGRYVIIGTVPKPYVGGTATMIVWRSNGQVLFLNHGK